MRITFGLNCPSCGGRIEVEEGDTFVICPFCHTVSRIVGEEDVRTLAYKMKVDEAYARNAANMWFKRGFKARDLKKFATIKEIYPVYLPFWKYSAVGLGVICGYNYKTTTDSQGHTRREKVYKEEQVRKDYVWTKIACDAGDIGIDHLRNTEGEVIPLPEDVPKYEVTTSKDDARLSGEESIKRWILREAHIENITFHKEFVIPKSFTLLYYPVWIIRYDYKGKMYFLTVDGVTGQVLSGRAPGDALWQSLVIGAGATVGGALAGLAPMGAYYDGRLATLMLSLGIIIFGASYYFFRYGSEIIEGDIEKPYKLGKLNDVIGKRWF
jgi:predicted RNA-binding Zn-ribbon protein involved in translation (DUF1610 family)